MPGTKQRILERDNQGYRKGCDPENTVVHKGSKSLAMKHISYQKSYKQITNGHTHQSHKTA